MSATPAFRLDQHVGYLLRRAYVRSEQAAAAAVPLPFHGRELAVLEMLAALGPRSQQELADLLLINRTVMVKVVDDLEERSLVRRERNSLDERSYALVPTSEGRAELRRLSPRIGESEDLLAGDLTTQERARLVALLALVPAGEEVQGADFVTRRCGYLINRAHFALRDRARDRLAALGIDSRRLGALAAIDERQPCSQRLLAKRLAISAPVVGILVKELADAGLVERARQASDRRRYDLTLSATGRERLVAGARVVSEIEAELDRQLTPDGQVELRQLLTTLVTSPPLPAPGVRFSRRAPSYQERDGKSR